MTSHVRWTPKGPGWLRSKSDAQASPSVRLGQLPTFVNVAVPALNADEVKTGARSQIGSVPLVPSSSMTWMDQGLTCDVSRPTVRPFGGITQPFHAGENVLARTGVRAATD